MLVTLQMMVLYLDALAEDRIAWRPKARQRIRGFGAARDGEVICQRQRSPRLTRLRRPVLVIKGLRRQQTVFLSHA